MTYILNSEAKNPIKTFLPQFSGR